MKNKIVGLFKYIQYFLLILSFYTCSVFKKKYTKVEWIIGVDEIAKIIFLLKDLFINSYTVSLSQNPFYKNVNYSFYNRFHNKYIAYFYRVFIGPILLGYLSNKSDKFIYIWHTGFLIDREFEFRFLKSKNKKIICIFVGSDIRSLKLRKELYLKLDIDGSANYLQADINEKRVKNVARIADLYADVIFSASIDQISYLKIQH